VAPIDASRAIGCSSRAPATGSCHVDRVSAGAPPEASAAENPQLRRLAPAPIFVVRSVLWP